MKNRFILFLSVLVSGAFFGQTGQVGINTATPRVHLDARATTGNSAIAFGNTNQTAPAAGAGAMKYDNSVNNNGIYYSDGVVWQQFLTSGTTSLPKVVAAGRKTVDEIISTNTGDTHPWLFQNVILNDGNWNSTTNSYTVPQDGLYQMSMGAPLRPSQVNNLSEFTIFVYDSTGTNEVRNFVFRGIDYSVGGAAFRGGTLTFELKKDQIVKFGSVHCYIGCLGNTVNFTIGAGALFTIVQL
ncbi:hypothetical protein SAMN05421841_0598 [Chryseobacterium wanjuense]|jgi:hypothetical protein|uniref:C1q domain-containing protein n=1 Tax=Chryseobacterium wanjuense TaxID=356305 RepID=A0A1I0NHM5_9FLAO|nr:hypothetical protein [Chryseobacterium wanjuense]SEW00882.1 hypothetical protein SAMN05421841_0598 [Chryseobacterium wanjuense]